MIDVGAAGKVSTWRRPHLPSSASRIDHHILSRNFIIKKYDVKFTRFDHTSLCTELEFNHDINSKPILKDWSLASTMFLDQAPHIIQKVLFENDNTLRERGRFDRERFAADRKICEYENELKLIDVTEGVFHSHILLAVIDRLTHLHEKVQNKLKYKRKFDLEKMSKELASLYNRVDMTPLGHPDLTHINERIIEIKNKIRIDS